MQDSGRTGDVILTAASTRFNLELGDARRVNRDGLAHVIAFAKRAAARGGLRRLHHVSTAYAAGTGLSDDGRTPLFRNTYERSKWEAEQLLHEVGEDISWTCYRPSIIVGDSRSGRTPHFRALYDPIKWVHLRGLRILPCRPSVKLDVVPVDYVCDAILAIAARTDSVGRTYRLASGPERSISIQKYADGVRDAGHAWQRRAGDPLTPAPELISPEQVEMLPRDKRKDIEKVFAAANDVMRAHLPYMLEEQLFDAPETRTALERTGIECPRLSDYLSTLIFYAADHNWGEG